MIYQHILKLSFVNFEYLKKTKPKQTIKDSFLRVKQRVKSNRF